MTNAIHANTDIPGVLVQDNHPALASLTPPSGYHRLQSDTLGMYHRPNAAPAIRLQDEQLLRFRTDLSVTDISSGTLTVVEGQSWYACGSGNNIDTISGGTVGQVILVSADPTTNNYLTLDTAQLVGVYGRVFVGDALVPVQYSGGVSSTYTPTGISALLLKVTEDNGGEWAWLGGGVQETLTAYEQYNRADFVQGVLGETIASGDVLYFDPNVTTAGSAVGAWMKAVSTALVTGRLGVAAAGGDEDDIVKIQIAGICSLANPAFTNDGYPVAVSDTGTLTVAPPMLSTGGAQKSYPSLGQYWDEYQFDLTPRPTIYMIKATLATTDTLTLEHAFDPSPFRRRVTVTCDQTGYVEPVPVGQWSDMTATIVCRYDDGTGSDASTMTTIKNQGVASLTVTLQVSIG